MSFLAEVYKESPRERQERREPRRSSEVQREEAYKGLPSSSPSPPPLRGSRRFENKFIFQDGALRGAFVYEKRRELEDKSEIRGLAVEGGAGTRIQSRRQGIAVIIRHSNVALCLASS